MVITNSISLRPSRPRDAALALAFGLFLAADATGPAHAACSSTSVTIFRVEGSYACYMNCAVSGGSARAIRSMSFVEVDASGGFVAATNECYRACSTTPGCTSVGFVDWYERPTAGGGRHFLQCTLYGDSGHETTADMTPGRGPAPDGKHTVDDYWVCLRLPPNFRDPGERIDRDQFRPDVYRPGTPGATPGIPGKR